MRLDWIFLPRENHCAKFYIIIIITIIIIKSIRKILVRQGRGVNHSFTVYR